MSSSNPERQCRVQVRHRWSFEGMACTGFHQVHQEVLSGSLTSLEYLCNKNANPPGSQNWSCPYGRQLDVPSPETLAGVADAGLTHAIEELVGAIRSPDSAWIYILKRGFREKEVG
jgi:hypothetical protein